MRLILLGPPGAGKGTQAKLLSEKFKIPHISTGDILRQELSENSELGRRVAKFVTGGELVPDDIVIELVINRLARKDAQEGFILDGFPRTLDQAQHLEQALKQLNTSVDLVIYFKTSLPVSIRRLSGRRVCKGCGANFHLTNMPPKSEGICDFCGKELFLRDDDKEETVKKRLAIYQSQTASLIDYYKRSAALRTVSGDLEAEQVNSELIDLFKQENLNDKD
jgi:adenylate kinase